MSLSASKSCSGALEMRFIMALQISFSPRCRFSNVNVSRACRQACRSTPLRWLSSQRGPSSPASRDPFGLLRPFYSHPSSRSKHQVRQASRLRDVFHGGAGWAALHLLLYAEPLPRFALSLACALRMDSMVSGPIPSRFSFGLGFLKTRVWCSRQYALRGCASFGQGGLLHSQWRSGPEGGTTRRVARADDRCANLSVAHSTLTLP